MVWIDKKKISELLFSTRECPKILKICQVTNFDMGFQKIKRLTVGFTEFLGRERKLQQYGGGQQPAHVAEQLHRVVYFTGQR